MIEMNRQSTLTKQPIDSHESLYLSDDDISDEDRPPTTQGGLSKWTNMLHGWQERYFILRDGLLSYYKSKDDVHNGCRGSIRIVNGYVRPHEADDCRFEIRVCDSIWYLRTSTIQERRKWIEAIEYHRISESGYDSEQNLRRQNSWHSLNSVASLSIASASSFKRSHGLKEKLAEMETFKEILCRQVESLQNYFDTCSVIVRDAVYDKLERYLMNDDHDSDEHECSFSNEYKVISDHPRTNSSDGVSISSESVASETVITNCQIDISNNGTIFEDARESLAETGGNLESPFINSLNKLPLSVKDDAKQQTILPQQSRGFLSKFFPFRSNTTMAITCTENRTTPNESTNTSSDCNITITNPTVQETTISTKFLEDLQYEPSSRFEDLKKILKQHGGHALDFKGEAYTFKATTTGILTNLCYCIEIMQQREDAWRRRHEREVEKRRKLEETTKSLLQEVVLLKNQLSSTMNDSNKPNSSITGFKTKSPNDTPTSPNMINSTKLMMIGNPDLQEGPNCAIGEEEFFDAVDTQLDQMELEDERMEALKYIHQTTPVKVAMSLNHPLYDEIQSVVNKHLKYCDPTANELRIEDGWQLIAEEGEIRIYRKEVENDEGIVLDPLQIVHEVKGVTAREMCNFFWDVKHRMEWEITTDQPPTVLEFCGEDTFLLHQIYKRVWPTTQRDAVFWSHCRQIDNEQLARVCSSPPLSDQLPYNMWLVMNYSTDYKAPMNCPADQMIRLILDVVLICQTIIVDEDGVPIVGPIDINSVTRDRVKCKLLYASSVNPGGWVPASVLRTVAKREYPRFIKRFCQYVRDKTVNSKLNF